ncbi:ATP phosphoribosyltransferase regulatory subunit [Roseospira marina]|uniref:ATP phosphoribosyltransferase regulatory subunit n=1 Tax=Roseospira marina TaxID=140057 RepID=A0A5M6I9S6_9PROT|nr:ATP phosphoribosyltransferase regulatory subunit [Roseospira marina]KAA5605036.1 ATP phosphoribosyltransferase regulatory subunit [Roseospira marina]MBB4314953.1 ATP phosphoribosyltransferase regulatory subunit [Roseospira marina]MBB5087953.1 ATP phosphoribosyltransferase regulatory subunit [Roseospira marina]
MIHAPHPALLPNGLNDGLPPRAEREADVVDGLMAFVRGHGYRRVKPPLIEFEDGLLAGAGAALARDTFRVMDPVSQRMMGVRPDFTVQIGRIATTRLRHDPRPLRLCYAGQVLRVRGTQLRPERQFTQVGAELIGADTPAAEAEIVVLAAEALEAEGVVNATIDLNLPTLLGVLCEAHAAPEALREALRVPVDHKDVASVQDAARSLPDLGAALVALIQATGPAREALAEIAALGLPPAAAERVAALHQLVDHIEAAHPGLTLTVDALESRGFEYYTGFGFSIFARGARGELARGGRYIAGPEGRGQPATGFTLMMDAVLDAMPEAPLPRRVLAPVGHDRGAAARLRRDGWTVLQALEADIDLTAEARRLDCGFVLGADGPEALT